MFAFPAKAQRDALAHPSGARLSGERAAGIEITEAMLSFTMEMIEVFVEERLARERRGGKTNPALISPATGAIQRTLNGVSVSTGFSLEVAEAVLRVLEAQGRVVLERRDIESEGKPLKNVLFVGLATPPQRPASAR